MLSDFNTFKQRIFEQGLYYDDNFLLLLYSALNVNHGVRAILLRGPPGVGKTALTRAIANILNADYVFYQCTLGTSEDELLYKYIPSEKTRSGIRIIPGPLPDALRRSREKPVVLVLDEFDKTRPSTDALLLDFLQNARVSVRIDEEEEVIVGKKENLIVFLTSNDEREFSEPLLRRLARLDIPHLDYKLVYRVLIEHGVDEKTATLLTQLYLDTIYAGLRKPATIQELLQLAEAIRILGDNADFTALVRTYIIKNDDDWYKYREYIITREPYRFTQINNNDDEESDDITSAYETNEEEQEVNEVENNENEKQPKMPKKVPILIFNKKYEEKHVEKIKEETTEPDEIIETGFIKTTEDAYDELIKIFKPEPSDRPEFLKDVAEIRKDYIVFKNRIDYNMYRRILYSSHLRKNANILVIIPIERNIIDDYKIIIELARKHKAKILYYSKQLIRLKYYDNSDEVLYDIAILNDRIETRIETKDKNIYSYHDYAKLLDRLVVLGHAETIQKIVKVVKEWNEWIEEFKKEASKYIEESEIFYVLRTNTNYYWKIDNEEKKKEIYNILKEKYIEVFNKYFNQWLNLRKRIPTLVNDESVRVLGIRERDTRFTDYLLDETYRLDTEVG